MKQNNNAVVVSETRAATIAAIMEKLKASSKVRASVNHVYQILETGDATVKLPPQAVEVLSLLFGTNKTTITDMEVREVMEASTLKTKQSKYLIFKYYRAALIKAGFLKLQK
jgi:hypothetical protein